MFNFEILQWKLGTTGLIFSSCLVGPGTEAPHIKAAGISRPSVADDVWVSRGSIEFTVCARGADCGNKDSG